MEDVVEVAYANGYSPREIQAAYGTPVIDGKLDSVWNKTEVAEIDRQTLGENGVGATGTVRCLWDEKNFYVYTEIKDDILNAANEYSYYRDNIEVFVSERNTRSTYYDAGDCQLRYTVDGNMDGIQYGGFKDGCFDAAMIKTKDGYNMEFVYHMEYVENAAENIMGFDVSITDHVDGSGVRRSQRKFCDNIGQSHITAVNWGTTKLVQSYVPKNETEASDNSSVKERINFEIDGKNISFEILKAENDEYLIPLKHFMEFLDGKVRYNPQTAEINLLYNGKNVVIKENSAELYTDSGVVNADASVSAADGKMYVPLNALCRSMQLEIKSE